MSVITRRSWRIGIPTTSILLALILSLAVTLALRAQTHASSALVQISSDPFTNPDSQHKTQVEPDSFAFGNTVVSAFQSGRFFGGGASDIGWATSTNGGLTWAHGFLPDATVNSTPPNPMYKAASDASVAYDAKHKVWMISFLGIVDPVNGPVDVLVSRSTDGGLTFGNPVVVNATGVFNDKNWTVCDDTASSPFFGHCYTEFDNNSSLNRVQMSTSKNGGLTWGAAKSTPDNAFVIGGQPVVQPNGTVIVPIDDGFEATLLAFRSTNGGNTWTKPVLAAQILNDGHPGGIRSPDLPSAEIDKSGRVYVVWTDCRFEASCNAGTNDLMLVSSADGVNWTLPKRIPADPVGSGVDHLLPGLAVDRSTSGRSAHLALTYYYFPSINCDVNTCALNVGFITSTNGGASWSTAQQLAGPMSLTWLPNTSQGRMVADYISTSFVPGDSDATPVFEVAFAPTVGTDCAATGAVCDQATYTTPEDALQITGGTNVSNDAAPAFMPINKGALSKPATAF
jgi:hypothetical protein